jgi:hypothetical protein
VHIADQGAQRSDHAPSFSSPPPPKVMSSNKKICRRSIRRVHFSYSSGLPMALMPHTSTPMKKPALDQIEKLCSSSARMTPMWA